MFLNAFSFLSKIADTLGAAHQVADAAKNVVQPLEQLLTEFDID